MRTAPPVQKDGPRINEEINARQVHLIDKDGSNRGNVSISEAIAFAHAAGLDLERLRDVVNASSGASWIFADRIPRALQNDLSPRAAVKLLAKDVAIAVALAERLRIDAPFSKLARGAFSAAVAAGHAEDDDAVLMRLAVSAAARSTED